MAEELEIVIGANVDDAKQGINSLSGVINDFAQKGKLSIGVVEQSMAQLRAIIKNTTDPAELAKLNAAFKELQRTLNNLKIQGGLETQLGGVSRATRLAHSDLDQMALSLRGIASGSERGIDGLSNLIFTFERLSGVSGGIGNGLAELGESLLGPAGIVLAVTTLLPAVVSLVGELGNSETAAEKNKKAFDDLNVILADSKKAFDELQTKVKFLDDIGPINLEIQFGKGFQADILDLNAKVLELNDEILKQQEVLTNALNARRAAQNAADDAALAASENATKANKKAAEDANKVLQDSIKAEDDANKTLTDLLNQRDLIYRKAALTRTQNQRDADKKANDAAIKQLEEFNKQFTERVKRLADSFDIRFDLKFSVDDTPDKALDKAKKIIQGIEDHEIRLKVIVPDKIELPKLEFEFDKPGAKKRIEDLAKGNLLELGVKLIPKTLLEQLEGLKRKLADDFAFDPKNITQSLSNVSKLILTDKELQDALKLSISLETDPEKFAKSLNEIKQNIPKELQGQLDIALQIGDIKTIGLIQSIAKMNEQITKAINDGIANIGAEGFDAIGEAIGTALSGGDIDKVFKQFGEALGSAVEALGKQIVALGIAAALTKKAITSLFATPGVAIIAGIALIAIGAALKNLIGGGIKGFAEGGRPPVGKPSVVGEKGWELFVPDQPGTILSHDKSVSLLSSKSVERNNEIKEYLSTQLISNQLKTIESKLLNVVYKISDRSEKTSQSLIERFTAHTASISNIITANNDKLTAYSYRLHESTNNSVLRESFKANEITRLISSFKDVKETDSASVFDKFTEVSKIISSVKDSFKDSTQTHQTHPSPAFHPPFTVEKSESFKTISDSLSKIVSTDRVKDSSAFRESSSTEKVSNSSLNSFIEKLSKSDTLFKDSSVSFNSKETFFNSSSLNDSIEKLRTSYVSVISDNFGLTTIYDKSKSYEGQSEKTFVNNTSSVRDNSFFDSTNTLRESLKESFSKLLSSHSSESDKEYFEHIKDIINERGFERTLNELLRESFKESKITSDKFVHSIKEKSTDRSNDRSTFLNSSTNETSTLKTILSNLSKTTERSKEIIDRMIEKATITSSTEKHNSVHIEKVVNNNFFSDSISSSKELIKSMSVERFGKMFGIPAFAQGGAVFGPTLAILGEGFGISRSNPEFVGTRDQLKGIQGGQFDVNVNVNGDISFDMGRLALALNKEQRSYLRTNGKKPF